MFCGDFYYNCRGYKAQVSMLRATITVMVAGRAAVNVTDKVEEEELSAPHWTGLILAMMKVCFVVGNVINVVNILNNGKKTNGLGVFCFTKDNYPNANKPSFYKQTEKQIGRQDHRE
ncbi:hypothetical protein ILYODFUR_026771 [Ilyodon furcidens]|uniref:Uncharacterized protein n=1 Tax=Ilyodon furcidens TaxID=33524 RepID=A0ABV0SSL6_9TELE